MDAAHTETSRATAATVTDLGREMIKTSFTPTAPTAPHRRRHRACVEWLSADGGGVSVWGGIREMGHS